MSKTSKEEALAEALRQARDASTQVGDAARKIWLAGLGAFAKANAGGGELFGKLMKQGAEFESATRKTAGERLRETRESLEETVERASRQGKETWTKVEKAVAEQLKRSLDKLGVAGQKDVDAINQRIDQIAAGVRKAAAARAGASAPVAAKASPPAPPAAKKAPAAGKAAPAGKSAATKTKAAPAKKTVAKNDQTKPVAKPVAAAKAPAKTATKPAAASPAKAAAAPAPAPAPAKKVAAKTAVVAPATSAGNKTAAVRKAGATIAAKRAPAKSSLPKKPPVARKRDEIADIAAELETAQLAARQASKPALKSAVRKK